MVSQNDMFNGNSLFGQNLLDVFEQEDIGRRAIFQSFLPQNANPLQSRQFGQLYEPTFNAYLGSLAGQIRQGQVPGPDQSFTNFLQGPGFNAQRSLLQLPDFSFGGTGLGPNIFDFGSR